MALLAKPYERGGGHYYLPDGTPLHTVKSKDGKKRPTNLRDAKKLNLLPSVTEMLKVIASFGLEDWKIKEAVKAVARVGLQAEGETEAYWIERVIGEAFEQVEEAKTLGSGVHNALESYARGEPFPQEYEVYIKPIIAWQEEKGLTFVENEKVVVNAKEGYAGTMDKAFVFGTNGKGVLDYKSKRTKPGQAVVKDTKYGMQLAAYVAAYWGVEALPTALAANVYFSTTEPGRMEVVKHDNLPALYDMFLSACALWRGLKGYDPRQAV